MSLDSGTRGYFQLCYLLGKLPRVSVPRYKIRILPASPLLQHLFSFSPLVEPHWYQSFSTGSCG